MRPQEDGRTREGKGVVSPSGSALSGDASFARLDWTSVLYRLCVCVFFPRKALRGFPRSALPPHPRFYSSCWAEGENLCAEFLDETKPNKRYLYIQVKTTNGQFFRSFQRDSLRCTLRTNNLDFFFFYALEYFKNLMHLVAWIV